MAKYVHFTAKSFAVFNMIDFCYKNFKGITSIINDSTDLSIALQNRHFRRNIKNFPKFLQICKTRAKFLRKSQNKCSISIDFFRGRVYNISETTNEKERFYAERIFKIYDSRPVSDWIRDNKSSQAKLAKEIGISEATLNRFMSGKTDTLGIEQIVKLAKIFGCSTDYLLGVTDIPRHQIIDVEELGLTENAATNIVSRTIPIGILNELLVDPHFIKALLLIDFYSSDYFAQIVERQNDFTKSMRDFAGKVNPKAKEVRKAVVLSKPNFKAEQLINIQYEFITAVKDIKKNSAANADNRANKEFLEKILAAFKPQDVMKFTPEQISVTIANVVKSAGNIDENVQKIFKTFGTELLKGLPSENKKNAER